MTVSIDLPKSKVRRLQEHAKQAEKGNVTEWNEAKRELGIG